MFLVKLKIRILSVFYLFFLFEHIFRFAFAVCIRNNLSPKQSGSSSSEHKILDCSRHDTQHFVAENRCQCPFHHPITYLAWCTLLVLDRGEIYIPESSCCRLLYSLAFQVFSAFQ